MLEEFYKNRKTLLKSPDTGCLLTAKQLLLFDIRKLKAPLVDIVQELAVLEDALKGEVPICMIRRRETDFELAVVDTLFADWNIGILLFDPDTDTGVLFPAASLKQKAAAIAVEN